MVEKLDDSQTIRPSVKISITRLLCWYCSLLGHLVTEIELNSSKEDNNIEMKFVDYFTVFIIKLAFKCQEYSVIRTFLQLLPRFFGKITLLYRWSLFETLIEIDYFNNDEVKSLTDEISCQSFISNQKDQHFKSTGRGLENINYADEIELEKGLFTYLFQYVPQSRLMIVQCLKDIPVQYIPKDSLFNFYLLMVKDLNINVVDEWLGIHTSIPSIIMKTDLVLQCSQTLREYLQRKRLNVFPNLSIFEVFGRSSMNSIDAERKRLTKYLAFFENLPAKQFPSKFGFAEYISLLLETLPYNSIDLRVITLNSLRNLAFKQPLEVLNYLLNLTTFTRIRQNYLTQNSSLVEFGIALLALNCCLFINSIDLPFGFNILIELFESFINISYEFTHFLDNYFELPQTKELILEKAQSSPNLIVFSFGYTLKESNLVQNKILPIFPKTFEKFQNIILFCKDDNVSIELQALFDFVTNFKRILIDLLDDRDRYWLDFLVLISRFLLCCYGIFLVFYGIRETELDSRDLEACIMVCFEIIGKYYDSLIKSKKIGKNLLKSIIFVLLLCLNIDSTYFSNKQVQNIIKLKNIHLKKFAIETFSSKYDLKIFGQKLFATDNFGWSGSLIDNKSLNISPLKVILRCFDPKWNTQKPGLFNMQAILIIQQYNDFCELQYNYNFQDQVVLVYPFDIQSDDIIQKTVNTQRTTLFAIAKHSICLPYEQMTDMTDLKCSVHIGLKYGSVDVTTIPGAAFIALPKE
eukprot:TRINITY_DN9263_c0_g1_i1.p1 TRINITY_DN9263_c0_g1~~TRINITY_DN9263_c0_g1_i1.p1  ORF type:complete len:846 (+),score=222.65 TRINITY_DN9263_c0_g1_i1:294-2540(+)